tara:strand:- start:4 stop:975 length:972 start_codon:yes stop_codon:yes gene_type:complete
MAIKNEFCGVILAAGTGQRIKPLSFYEPKPILPICNKPIVQYQIDDMKQLGIREYFIIVGGPLKDNIKKYFGDGSSQGIKITYVEQKNPLGIAHAVSILEEYIDRPFFVFLGDIFLVPRNLTRMLEIFKNQKTGAVLAVKKEKDSESIKRNFAVIFSEKNEVKKVIEKPRYIHNEYKGCGIYLFDLQIFDAIRNTPRTAMRDEYEITTSIQILLNGGASVYAAEVVDWDMNVTFPEDVLLCNQKQLKQLGKKEIIGENVKISKGTNIRNSVIGDKVEIVNPIKIIDSVIFSGATVNSEIDLEHCLVTPKLTMDFKRKVIYEVI